MWPWAAQLSRAEFARREETRLHREAEAKAKLAATARRLAAQQAEAETFTPAISRKSRQLATKKHGETEAEMRERLSALPARYLRCESPARYR